MKFINSFGNYVVVASEVSEKKTVGRLSIIEESPLVKGVVLADSENLYVDDLILFFRNKGTSVGHGLPDNVVAVFLDDVVAVVQDDEDV